MNITFFIGNGFDLNLGFHTRYSDFYSYYTKKYPNDLLAKDIDANKADWSDLEIGLGEFLKDRYQGSEEDFIESKNKMDNALSEFLSAEAGRNIVFTGDAAQGFQNRIVHVDQFLSTEDAERYRNETGSVGGVIHYCFINFNYTRSVDQIIEYARKNNRPFAVHRGGGSNYEDDIRDPIHIHGTTKEEMILGVNDIDQMSKEKDISDELMLAMIKSEINDSLGNRKNEIVQATIEDSKYIVIYGMSLGLTDLRWWKSIFEWLKKDKSKSVIIFHYSTDGSVPSGGQTAQRKNRVRREFFKKVGASQEECNQFKKQVIVQINSPIFNFQKISVEELNNNPEENEGNKHG